MLWLSTAAYALYAGTLQAHIVYYCVTDFLWAVSAEDQAPADQPYENCLVNSLARSQTWWDLWDKLLWLASCTSPSCCHGIFLLYFQNKHLLRACIYLCKHISCSFSCCLPSLPPTLLMAALYHGTGAGLLFLLNISIAQLKLWFAVPCSAVLANLEWNGY